MLTCEDIMFDNISLLLVYDRDVLRSSSVVLGNLQ